MTDNITLRRAAEQARSALSGWANHGLWAWPESALQTCKQNTEEALVALDAALAEPEQNVLRRDAERYRWLRGEVQGPHTPLAQVVWKRNNIRESGDWTNLSDGQALDEAIDAALDAALAEPPAKREPATMQQIVATHRTTYGAPWLDEFDRAWKAAERFHGIRGSKT